MEKDVLLWQPLMGAAERTELLPEVHNTYGFLVLSEVSQNNVGHCHWHCQWVWLHGTCSWWMIYCKSPFFFQSHILFCCFSSFRLFLQERFVDFHLLSTCITTCNCIVFNCPVLLLHHGQLEDLALLAKISCLWKQEIYSLLKTRQFFIKKPLGTCNA